MKVNKAIEEYRNNSFKKSNNLTTNSVVAKAFGFTNETLRQYYHLLKCKDGRVATVGSSGDQALYAVFEGAREVTLIDANPYAKPVTELKVSAIKNMTHSEFLDYWTMREVMKEANYRYLLGDVSDSTKDFLRYIKFKSKVDGKLLAKTVFKDGTFEGINPLASLEVWSNNCEFYDDENKFKILRDKLSNPDLMIRYKLAEYSKFPKMLDGKYDSIVLSNIYDYYLGREPIFYSVAETLKEKNLKKKGTMQLHYEMIMEDRIGKTMSKENKRNLPYKMYEVLSCNDVNLSFDNEANLFYCGKAEKLNDKQEKEPLNNFKEYVYICEK